MKSLNLKILVILQMLVLTSCIREVKNINLPGSDDAKIVVGCFISPQDTVITATITASHSPYGFIDEGYPVIQNAEVIISDGTDNRKLDYIIEDSVYQVKTEDFKILPGKSYQLYVTVPGMQEVKSSCIIPVSVNNTLNYKLDSISSSTGSFKTVQYKLSMEFEDLPDENNYYRIMVEADVEVRRSIEGLDTTMASFGFQVYNDDSDINVPDSRFEDFYSEGQSFRFLELRTYLLNIDANYYEYYRWFQNSRSGPFTEPKVVFSNIEGGLGVFAGYQKNMIRIVL